MTPLYLPYPVSANRYWRNLRGRMVRSEEADAYRRTVSHAAYVAGWPVLEGPVKVRIMLRPKLTKRGTPSQIRLDLDNCIKVALDSLNGIAYVDDRQVTRLLAEIGPPCEGGGLAVSVEAR